MYQPLAFSISSKQYCASKRVRLEHEHWNGETFARSHANPRVSWIYLDSQPRQSATPPRRHHNGEQRACARDGNDGIIIINSIIQTHTHREREVETHVATCELLALLALGKCGCRARAPDFAPETDCNATHSFARTLARPENIVRQLCVCVSRQNGE